MVVVFISGGVRSSMEVDIPSRSDVDPHRIASTGISLGGEG